MVAQDFAWFRGHHAENMGRMFAAIGDLYAEHWSDFFHFAVFDGDPEEGWTIAFERTHRRYAEALRLGGAGKVMELAFGGGGFAQFPAARTGGDVLGIDISRAQLSRATRRRPNLRFRHHDVVRVEELGEQFDAVAFLDAEC